MWYTSNYESFTNPTFLFPQPVPFLIVWNLPAGDIEMSINTPAIWGWPKVDARESRFQLCLLSEVGVNRDDGWMDDDEGDWFSFQSPKSPTKQTTDDGYWLLLRKVVNAWCALEKKKHHAKVALYGYRERSDVLQQVLEEVEMSLPVRGGWFVQDDGDNKFTSTWKVNNEGNQRWIIGEVFCFEM